MPPPPGDQHFALSLERDNLASNPVDAGEPPLGERRQWSWKALPAGSRLLGPARRDPGAQESVRCGARSGRAKKRTRTRRWAIDAPPPMAAAGLASLVPLGLIARLAQR